MANDKLACIRTAKPANVKTELVCTSLLAMSIWQRLALALGILFMLWLMVAWALENNV